MPNLDNEAVERAARLLNTRLASGDLFGVTRDIISLYLASLEAKGFVVAPSEPTAHMRKSGAYQVSFLTHVGADAVYRAMIAASRNTDTVEGDDNG